MSIPPVFKSNPYLPNAEIKDKIKIFFTPNRSPA